MPPLSITLYPSKIGSRTKFLHMKYSSLLDISCPPYTDSYSGNLRALNYATQYPRKQICINDDLNYDSKHIGDEIRLLTSFYKSRFPEKSSFEV